MSARVHCAIYPCPGHPHVTPEGIRSLYCAPDPIDAWQNAQPATSERQLAAIVESDPLPTDLQDGYTVGQRFREAVSPGYGVRAEAAWQLILDTWRVIEVASARAGAPATPTREEWMAALRIAASRAEPERDVTAYGDESWITRY